MLYIQHLSFTQLVPTNLMLKNTFCLSNHHWEILIPLKGSSVAVHNHFWRNKSKTAVLTFNILYTNSAATGNAYLIVSPSSHSSCFCYYFHIFSPALDEYLLSKYYISLILKCTSFSLDVRISEIQILINAILHLTTNWQHSFSVS